jgi:hypothetical protein
MEGDYFITVHLTLLPVRSYSMARPISKIAADIRNDWKKPYFGAVPYLEAMAELNSIDDQYMYDTGRSVVLYFLSNASTWRGPVARSVKAELKAL